MVDSSVSRRFPTIHLKNRRTFTLFTSDELTQPLGFSFRVCSSALLPRTYVDNLDFLTDYFIPNSHMGVLGSRPLMNRHAWSALT
jgi:hypothetical protein